MEKAEDSEDEDEDGALSPQVAMPSTGSQTQAGEMPDAGALQYIPLIYLSARLPLSKIFLLLVSLVLVHFPLVSFNGDHVVPRIVFIRTLIRLEDVVITVLLKPELLYRIL
jgi:hypothetical protein